MKAAAASSLVIAVLAATAGAAPVVPEQHPLVLPARPATPAAAASVIIPSKALPPIATSRENLVTAVWKSVVGGKDGQRKSLGRACFCSSGSICCSTSSGLDCTQGLCGI
ncbi:hypothetical protein CDEST_12026 [Colletotrichum destructivum]|uniref:Hydrophobin n=1 Tax=Colletotrichum destructivum TaxID=34406 RepID=A0AAX4IUV9_9PEZI|nr:hypothetical protein CDEST_12026 [Colletotrichum destructivum]